ncbi:MAG: fructose bisphosphate aldolase [Candidatus Planktophila sp.]
MRSEKLERIHSGRGFIAALDQSGGSTPRALKLYGIDESQYASESEMFDLVHQMRTRIIASPSFTSSRILAVILFEETMRRKIEGFGSAEYLWQIKGIPSFLKVDNGLADEENGVQLMKDIPQLQSRLQVAKEHGIIGTKMRSVIHNADKTGIEAILHQQFTLAREIMTAGLLPIIEPEVDIKSAQKREAESVLVEGLRNQLSALPAEAKVVLKLTLPEETNLYRELVAHPKVVRIAALSGGYSRDEASRKLALNDGLIASFSRALTEGLTVAQSDGEFNRALDLSIESIFSASH